ncbi:MAG: type II toxin-antitoxin system VapC family toxin [Candidatus Helarchaeota archaeon]
MIYLDTEACIALLKGKKGIKQVLKQNRESIAITSPTLFEIYCGIKYYEKQGIIKKNEQEILTQIDKFKIYSLDQIAALKASELWTQLKISGQMIKIMDILIGAIILTQNHEKIVTNDAHFNKIPGLAPLSYSMD